MYASCKYLRYRAQRIRLRAVYTARQSEVVDESSLGAVTLGFAQASYTSCSYYSYGNLVSITRTGWFIILVAVSPPMSFAAVRK